MTDASKQSNSNPYSSDPFYRYFFGDDAFGFGGDNGSDGSGGNGGSSSGSSQLVPTGIGSGFIFDKTGYILTNEHVVHNADVVQVTVQGTEKPYEAKVLGKSYELDLAVLKSKATATSRRFRSATPTTRRSANGWSRSATRRALTIRLRPGC
ncbi:hypothetical protein HMSSN139_34920 [Paenibacillus sp. HMSSN-139]|nr:hypothetical protein HMSSN139_34920 [Paenibacillus sp. HMSSN-139]